MVQSQSLWILVLFLCIFPVVVKTAPTKKQDVEYELVGDMLLPKKSVLTPLSGVLNPQYRWTNAVVPYEISSDFSSEEQRVILDAMVEIGRKTCVQFIPRVFEEDYVQIKHGPNGCYSNIGRIRGPQIVNLDQGCVELGTAIHELMHSLGFFHEQARSDRDQYVEIIWNNIEEDKKSQFEIIKEVQVTNFNVGYDYGSIMHYGRYDFSKYGTRDETIRPKPNSNVEIGQRRGLSPKDILKIRRMYKIADYGRCFSLRGTTTTTTTTNSPRFFPVSYFPSNQNQNQNQWPYPWQPVSVPIPRPRPSWIQTWFPWW